MEFDRKLNVLLILEALKKYTNENHYLSQTELTKRVNNLFDIELDRKTVREHLIALADLCDMSKESSLPFNVKRNKVGSFAMTINKFEIYEVNFLIDAIFASKYLNKNDAVDLAAKIIDFLSDDQQKIYNKVMRVYRADQINRTESVETLQTVEAIYSAIQDKKQITFQYSTYDLSGKLCTRDDGAYITTNPYKVIVKKGDYYLVGNVVGTDKISTYRIDYMEDTYALDEDRIEVEQIPGYEKGFDVAKYINEHIYFTDGKVVDAEILLTDSNAYRYVFDWFGKRAKIRKVDETLIASFRCDEDALYYWCMQYAEHIQVIKPESVVKRMFNTACLLQLNVFKQKEETKEKRLNLQGIFDNYVLISFTEPFKFNELWINDIWRTIHQLKTNETNYIHNIYFKHIGQMADTSEVIKTTSGRYTLTYILLLAREVLNYAEEHGMTHLYDGKESQPISLLREKFSKSRVSINEKATSSTNSTEGTNIEFCLDKLIALSNKEDQKDLRNIVNALHYLVTSYLDKENCSKKVIQDLFVKITCSYGFILSDNEMCIEINDIRKKAGFGETEIKFKEKK
mgnify:CR=1 FL=1